MLCWCLKISTHLMLWTNDAHRPLESVDGECRLVKKGVNKAKETNKL